MPVSFVELRDKREQILRLAERYRVRNVRLFGSVVHGRLEPWSDVDFMVDVVPGHTLFDRAGLVIDLSELLGTNVDVVAERELKDWVRPHATAEAVAL